MDVKEIYSLLTILKNRCPVDTGQLKGSIQPVYMSSKKAIIVIGNGTANLRSIPSDQYAAFTNNVKTLKTGKPNRNYHWANKAIDRWARANLVNIKFENEEEGEDTE